MVTPAELGEPRAHPVGRFFGYDDHMADLLEQTASHEGHGHSHGLVDDSIKRSRAGVRAVLLALLVLGVTAAVQALVFALSGSVALLADLIHNAGDAATAIPL